MNDSERRAWLRLARTENVGPVTFRNLLARFGTASTALDELPRLAARGGNKSFIAAEESEAARELESLAKLGGRLIASCEAGYPAGLAALDAPPPVISVLGHPHLLQNPTRRFQPFAQDGGRIPTPEQHHHPASLVGLFSVLSDLCGRRVLCGGTLLPPIGVPLACLLASGLCG